MNNGSVIKHPVAVRFKRYTAIALILSLSGCLPHGARTGSTGVTRLVGGEAPLTLAESYRLSLAQSEKIAIDIQRIFEAEAHFFQALGVSLPHASFFSNDYQQDLDKSASSTSAALGTRAKTSERGFNFSQTLFDGFKSIAGVGGSDVEYSQRVNEKKWGEELLMSDVADAFYLLAELREDLVVLRKMKSSLRERIAELRRREDLGRSRRSEVMNATVQLYQVESDMEQSRGRERVARHLLEFLVGRKVGEISYTRSVPMIVGDQDGALAKTADRPDVKAARQSWMVMKKAVVVANADFLPDVSLSGNSYVQRSGLNKTSDWDAVLSVNVPLFKGTETIGAVMEARTKEKASALEYRRVKRLAEQNVRDSYSELEKAVRMHGILKRALGATGLSYHLQVKDYQMSLVSNLDVLTALKALEDTRRNHIHALFESKRAYWHLLASRGEAAKAGAHEPF